VELILLVKHLLYTEKYTIDGARKRIEEYRRTGELKGAAKEAQGSVIRELRAALEDVLATLSGEE